MESTLPSELILLWVYGFNNTEDNIYTKNNKLCTLHLVFPQKICTSSPFSVERDDHYTSTIYMSFSLVQLFLTPWYEALELQKQRCRPPNRWRIYLSFNWTLTTYGQAWQPSTCCCHHIDFYQWTTTSLFWWSLLRTIIVYSTTITVTSWVKSFDNSEHQWWTVNIDNCIVVLPSIVYINIIRHSSFVSSPTNSPQLNCRSSIRRTDVTWILSRCTNTEQVTLAIRLQHRQLGISIFAASTPDWS